MFKTNLHVLSGANQYFCGIYPTACIEQVHTSSFRFSEIIGGQDFDGHNHDRYVGRMRRDDARSVLRAMTRCQTPDLLCN